MKQIPLVVCALLLVVSSVPAQKPVRSELLEWKTYTIKDADFSIALPTVPAMHTSYEFIERARRNAAIRQLGVYADGVIYTIYIHENPEPRQSLDEFVKTRGSLRLWDLTSARDVTVSGVAGKALLPANQAGGMAQFFAAEDRLYKFEAIGAPPDDGRVKKFFSSLSLTKSKDSVEVSDGVGIPYEPRYESGANNWSAGEQLFTRREVDAKTFVGMKPEPGYTEEARRRQLTGTVVLKCIFASDGTVKDIRLVSGLPFGLTEKAIEAARKIKFIPAVKDGRYVSMWMQLEYNFNLY